MNLPESGSRVSGSNFTLKDFRAFEPGVLNFNNFSDFELPEVNNFSNFRKFRQKFSQARVPRATKLLARKETLAQPADIEKIATGLRGLSGPAGGADFLDLHAKINDFLTILAIKPYP